MAAEIRGHDVGARVGLAVLLDKMESASSTRVPEAAPFVVREGADSGKNAGIDLRCNPERWITSVWKDSPCRLSLDGTWPTHSGPLPGDLSAEPRPEWLPND